MNEQPTAAMLAEVLGTPGPFLHWLAGKEGVMPGGEWLGAFLRAALPGSKPYIASSIHTYADPDRESHCCTITVFGEDWPAPAWLAFEHRVDLFSAALYDPTTAAQLRAVWLDRCGVPINE